MEEWRALVEAEREVARRRAELNRSPQRSEQLGAALTGKSTWGRSTALTFLRLFPEDVPQFLDLLVGLCLSQGWAEPAIGAIRMARGDIDRNRLAEIVMRHLVEGDEDEEAYSRLLEMATQLELWRLASLLVARGQANKDPKVRAIVRGFIGDYRGILPGVVM